MSTQTEANNLQQKAQSSNNENIDYDFIMRGYQ
jgi:hypothetical protein